MDLNTKNLFVRNLTEWTRDLIEHGRYPFRRVEDWPPLLTEKGEICPPLVLWINRDSFMAGGILLLPARKPDECFDDGIACARALGLQHFSTWSPQGIDIWEDCGDAPPKQVKTLPLPPEGAAQTGDFRWALQQLLEELKPLSVMGAVPPERLSAHYLANLCLSPLTAAHEELVEVIRSARAESESASGPSAAKLAQEKAYLVLVRLLSLTGANQIPENVQPEKLERALELTLPYLGHPLEEALQPAKDEIPLPYASAVRYHHLFRRLGQLEWGGDRSKAQDTLAVLLRQRARRLGLGDTVQGAEIAGETLLINPALPRPAVDRFQEAHQDAALRALGTLLRTWWGLSPARSATSDLFELINREPIARIEGILLAHGEQAICAGERDRFRLRLRTSWPNRRFALSPRAPRWLWEALHLLGLAAEGAAIDLTIPTDWLSAPFGDSLCDLLKEHFTLQEMEQVAPSQIRLALRKHSEGNSSTTFISSFGPRSLPWEELVHHPRTLWRLALEAPPSVFALLREHRLKTVPTFENLPAVRDGLGRFLASELGEFLWEMAAPGVPRPDPSAAAHECSRHQLALPEVELLIHLGRLEHPTPKEVEAETRRWLGDFSDLVQVWREKCPSRGRGGREKRMSEEESARIIDLVFADGLPRFPEKYLYAIYRPALQEFELVGPLHQVSEFLGTFELGDATGRAFQVEGEETAQALMLASFGGQALVRLPRDRSLTAEIVEKYLSELDELRRDLLRETHSRREKSQAARQWARKIWESLPLPPWDLLPE